MVKSIPPEMAPSAKQLVFWVMIAAFVAVSIFLCGVLVGQGMPRRVDDSGRNEPISDGVVPIDVIVPVILSGSSDSTSLHLDELSYFDRLHSAGPVSEILSQQTSGPSGEQGYEFAGGSARALSSSDDSPGVSFFLQVAALRGGAEAREVAASLAARGYPAFVVHPAPEVPVAMYWVRVGPYGDRAAAEEMSRRLEIDERFKPWVIQP